MALARFNEQLDGANVKNHLADCSFMNFEVDGSRVQLAKYDTHAKALDLQYMVRAMFRDLYIHGCAATGLGCDHLQDGTILGVIAERCGRQNGGTEPGGAGIGIGIGGWGGIERLDIIDCICTGNARHGIFVELQQGKPAGWWWCRASCATTTKWVSMSPRRAPPGSPAPAACSPTA